MNNSWQNPRMRKFVWIAAAFFVGVVVLSQVATRFAPPKEPPAMPQLAADVAPDVQERLTQAWPKVLNTCPGLAKYYHELQFERIDMAFPDATGAYTQTLSLMPQMENLQSLQNSWLSARHVILVFPAMGQACWCLKADASPFVSTGLFRIQVTI